MTRTSDVGPPPRRAAFRGVLTLAEISWLVAACVAAGASASPPTNPVYPAPDPSYEWGLALSNSTTLTVSLVVNGELAGTYRPGEPPAYPGIDPSTLPPLPWLVEARSPSGRVLLTLRVTEAPSRLIYGSGGSLRGSTARVDLSCGRIDVYAGPPLFGPAPGPGTPGDCAP